MGSLGFSVFLGEIFSDDGLPCGNVADLYDLSIWARKVGFSNLWLGPIWLMDSRHSLAPYSVTSRFFIDPLYLPAPLSSSLELEFPVDSDAFTEMLSKRRANIARGYLQTETALLREHRFFDQKLEIWLKDRLESEHLKLLCETFYEIGFGHSMPQELESAHIRDLIDRAVAAQVIGLGYLKAADNVIPLGLDLPVGVTPDGIDATIFTAWTIKDGLIGAPPDFFNSDGQRWGLVGFDFGNLAGSTTQFQPLHQILSLYSLIASAVRIDHAIGLDRLCIIRGEPRGDDSSWYYFVNQPRDALLDFLSTFSSEHQLAIVAEDLGIVPAGLRTLLVEANMSLMKVLCFEESFLGNLLGKDMIMLTTHDGPTAYWLVTTVNSSSDDEFQMIERLKVHLESIPANCGTKLALEFEHLVGTLPYRDEHHLDYFRSQLPALVAYMISVNPKFAVLSLRDILGDPDRLNCPGTTVSERLNFFRPISAGSEFYYNLLSIESLFELSFTMPC